MRSPSPPLTSAAAKAMPKLTLNAARFRGSASRSTTPSQPSPAALATSAAMGARRMSPSQVRVSPRDNPNPGSTRRCARAPIRPRTSVVTSSPRLVDPVEDALVGEMLRLGRLPAAEHLVDGEELELGELAGVA